MVCGQQRIRRGKRTGIVGTWLLFVVVATIGRTQGVSAESVLTEPEFVQAYDTYYVSLNGYGVEVLTAELSDTVEDALISGSHIRTTSIRYKVRHFEDVVHKTLVRRLCPVQDRADATRGTGTSETLQKAVVASIGPASTNVGVSISPGLYGRIAALLVRVLESMQRSRFCASMSFRNLSR